jgi:exosortase family protein XrtF
MLSILKNPFYRFISLAVLLFVTWELLYEFVLTPGGKVDTWIVENIIFSSEAILSLLGFSLIPHTADETIIRTIGIDGGHHLWVGDNCNGLVLFALFAGFVIAFPGKLKHKAWFIPLGIVSIHLVNVLRIVGLSIINRYYPEYLDFNHTYTFTVIVYSFVFGLWYIWATKLAGQGLQHPPKNQTLEKA